MTTAPNPALDPAIIRARTAEDVQVGNQIVRHRLGTRLMHWSAALSFAVALLTGLPIWTPIFGWLAGLFGGLSVCRWLHPWSGTIFFFAMVVMFAWWLEDMALEPGERDWFGKKLFTYMMHETIDDWMIGKYNGGQKIFFFAVCLGALGLMLSGLLLWFPESLPPAWRGLGIVVHEITFILFAVAIVFHVYLGTGAEPGTFRSMTRGTVPLSWARLHHPRWYREITGDDRPRT